jgi:hypothetical protein
VPLAAAHHGISLNGAYLLAGAIAATVAVIATAIPLVRALHRGGKRVGTFLDDWAGTEPRPGVERRPGVMERLADHDELIRRVLAETTPNGGKSMRDAVAQTAQDVAEIKTEQAGLRGEVERMRTSCPCGPACAEAPHVKRK